MEYIINREETEMAYLERMHATTAKLQKTGDCIHGGASYLGQKNQEDALVIVKYFLPCTTLWLSGRGYRHRIIFMVWFLWLAGRHGGKREKG
jgi:hypothetical protein